MKKITINKNDFCFDEFAESIVDFLARQGCEDPSSSVARVSAPGGMPKCGPGEGRPDFLRELEEGGLLFFPFSGANMGEPIPCADGVDRLLDEGSGLFFGDIDCVGFLVELKGDDFVINSAVDAGGCCPGPPPSVDITTDCGVFDAPMEAFLQSFIRQTVKPNLAK